MNSELKQVFVYGTLRSGQPNHYHLRGQHLLGQARTTPSFNLVSLGHFPAMIHGGTTAVIGEVYEVDGQALEDMDRLEGHPGFYRRESIALEDGRQVLAYLLPKDQSYNTTPIPSGDWMDAATQRRRW